MRRAMIVAILCAAAVACARTYGEQMSAKIARLEARLIAPCCWLQTLDIHESPIARALRGEIERRVAGGESPATIEEDLVARHGERIRAVAKGSDLGAAKAVAFGVMFAGLLGGAWLGRRFLVRGRAAAAPESVAPPALAAVAPPAPESAPTAPAAGAPATSRYDDLLDDELDAAD